MHVHTYVLCIDIFSVVAHSMSGISPQVSLEIREATDSGESPFLKLIVTRIGAHVKARSFDLSVNAYLGGIYLQQLQYKSNGDDITCSKREGQLREWEGWRETHRYTCKARY